MRAHLHLFELCHEAPCAIKPLPHGCGICSALRLCTLGFARNIAWRSFFTPFPSLFLYLSRNDLVVVIDDDDDDLLNGVPTAARPARGSACVVARQVDNICHRELTYFSKKTAKILWRGAEWW
jgi:hypothetical protein